MAIPIAIARSAPPAGRWQVFSSAPHRMMFLAGAVQGFAILALWAFDLLGRYTGLLPSLPWKVPSAWGHSHLLIYGFFPFWMFGFLMTAMPSWLGKDKVARRTYVPAWALLAAGAGLAYPALFTGGVLAGLSLALSAAGWAVGLAALLGLFRNTSQEDLRHPLAVAAAVTAGLAGLLASGGWLATGEPVLMRAAIQGGVWLFLLPVFLTVSHRMIPFFTSRALANMPMVRPFWPWWVLLGTAVGHGLLAVAGMERLAWPLDLAGMAAALHLTRIWGIRRSFEVRLVAVLHLAFLWLSFALALFAAQGIAATVGGVAVLGLAPLHLLTIGYFAAMVVGMASRVTLGHAGRPLVADGLIWGCFLGLLAVSVLRAIPDVAGPGAVWLLPVAAVAWLAAVLPWVLRHAPLYLLPRTDGKPG